MVSDESFDDRWSRMATLLITLYAIKQVKADQLESLADRRTSQFVTLKLRGRVQLAW